MFRDKSGATYYSVTSLIGAFFHPFNIPSVINTEERQSPSSIRGMKIHKNMEKCIRGTPLSENDKDSKALMNVFYKIVSRHKDFTTILPEFSIINNNLRIGGRLDLLLTNGKECIIVDWKICKNMGEIRKLSDNNPLCRYPDCKYSRWCVQLNMYRQLVEESLGLKTVSLYVGVVNPKTHISKLKKIPIRDIPINKMVREVDIILTKDNT